MNASEFPDFVQPAFLVEEGDIISQSQQVIALVSYNSILRSVWIMSCCSGSKNLPHDPSFNGSELPLHSVEHRKHNSIATFRTSMSNAYHAPWRALYEWNSVHYEDQLLKKITEFATEVVRFALYSGCGNRVLGFWCGLFILTWALYCVINDLLTLRFYHHLFNFVVFLLGGMFMLLEFKITLLPRLVMKFIEEECRFVLKPYLRSGVYMFCGAYITVQASFVEERMLNESTMIRVERVESWILGCLVFFTSSFMLYRSFMTHAEMQKIIDGELNIQQITERFHNHELCNSGTFQTSDFMIFLASNNIELPHDQLVSLMMEIDPNHTETVNYYEFLTWYKNFMSVVIYTNLLRVNVGLPLLYHVPGII